MECLIPLAVVALALTAVVELIYISICALNAVNLLNELAVSHGKFVEATAKKKDQAETGGDFIAMKEIIRLLVMVAGPLGGLFIAPALKFFESKMLYSHDTSPYTSEVER